MNLKRDVLILRKGTVYSSIFNVKNTYEVGQLIDFDFYKSSLLKYKKMKQINNIKSINILLKNININVSRGKGNKLFVYIIMASIFIRKTRN